MHLLKAAVFVFSKGAPILVADEATALTSFGNISFFGFPEPALLFLIIFALSAVLLKYNFFGRIIIAIGSNVEAVRLSGIQVSVY
jgi:ribose transport system permease protein